MIHTANQLKALVRNMSKGNSTQAQVIIRNYMMERFLERLSKSKYRDNFILKGGTLISAMVGLDVRASLDIDTTLRGLPLTVPNITEFIGDIISVPLDDGVSFRVVSISDIMEEEEYPGLRVMMETKLESMRTPLKIDISTGDIITPKEIEYQFKLMFEDRSINILAYNLETVLSEKLETIISHGTANTRLRDFYDIYILQHDISHVYDPLQLTEAYAATCAKRETLYSVEECLTILEEVRNSPVMQTLWKNYQKKYEYAAEYTWEEIQNSVKELYLVAAGR